MSAVLLALSMLGGTAPAAVLESDRHVTVEPSALPTTGEALDSSPLVHTHPAGEDDLASLAAWAVARFESAQLRPPPVAIHMHRDRGACGGNRGMFNPGAMRIDVCVAEALVVLHEIAHAWNHVNLAESVRSAYLAAGGFESWNAPGTRWQDRGSEDAADTIAWALLEKPISVPTPDGPIAERDRRYRLLTGNPAPRVVRP